MSLSEAAFGRVFVTFYDTDRAAGYQYLVIVSPHTTPTQELKTLSTLQWLWDELIKNDHISAYAFQRAQAILLESQAVSPSEKVAALQKAIIALVDEEIIHSFWADPRLKDSENFLESARWNGLRASEPLDDGRTAIAFVFGKNGISANLGITIGTPESPVKAEEEYLALGLDKNAAANSSSIAVQLPNSEATGFKTIRLSDNTQRLSGEFRRLYNSTPNQEVISVLMAGMLTQRQLFSHSYLLTEESLEPELQSVVDRLWIRTDFVRSKLYSSPTRGYGFTEVARTEDALKGETAFLLGDTSSYMNLVKKNEAAVLQRATELTMMRSLFTEGPYKNTTRSRRPYPERFRKTSNIVHGLMSDISTDLAKAIRCRTALDPSL